MKRLITVIGWVAVFILLLGRGETACAAGAPESIDVIMILDCSGSMVNNDKNRLMLKAAVNFIDMCDVSGTSVALIPFGTSLLFEDTIRFIRLDDMSNRDSLRRRILGNAGGRELNYTGATDAGRAFLKAKELYNSRTGNQHKTILLFFSDGVVQIDGDFSNPSQTRTAAMSRQEVSDVVSFFADKNIPIYVIGLNGDGNYSKEWLDDIASRTGTGLATEVKKSEDTNLQEVFSDIFATYLGTVPMNAEEIPGGVNGVYTYNINIPNNSIIEANINLSILQPGRNTQFLNVTVVDPDGNPVQPNQNRGPIDSGVVMGDARAYYNIKLIRPRQGVWKLTFSPSEMKVISAKMISNYDIGIRLLPPESTVKNSNIPVKAEFYSIQSGEAYNDPYLYRQDMLNGSEFLAKRNGNTIEGFSFLPSEDQTCLMTVIEKAQVGHYEIYLKINHDGIITDTTEHPLTFDVVNQPPKRQGADLPPFSGSVDGLLYRQANDKLEIDLGQYFYDPDNDPLTYQITRQGVTNDQLSISIEGSKLKIQLKQACKGTLQIIADDGTIHADKALLLEVSAISCSAQVIRELMISAACLLFIIAATVIYKIKTKPRFTEYAHFAVSYTGLAYTSPPLPFISLARYGTSPIGLYKMMDDSQSAECDLIKDNRTSFESISIVPRKGGIIRLVNHTRGSGYLGLYLNAAVIKQGEKKDMNPNTILQVQLAGEERAITFIYQTSSE